MVTILAIDDNGDNLISLRALIGESFSDARVLTAQSGKKGIDLAVAEDPDVILLDILMPDMDGFEVCRALKADERSRDTPVVFLTAIKADRDSRVRALESGGDAFLSKPIDSVELTAQIKAMIKIKAAERRQRDEQSRLERLVAERTFELEQSHVAMLNLLEDLKSENEARKLMEFSLAKALKENQELLSELQHRAKNSFNMIFSMIDLAMISDDEPANKAPFVELGNRVRAISSLYDLLYRAGSLAEIPLDTYCARIAAPIIGLSNLNLRQEMKSLTIPARLAAPVGLIVVELVTNTIKYAFPENRKGTVSIILNTTESGVHLEICDDGIGLPPGFNLATTSGKGLSLVQGLAAQVGGEFTIESDSGGTRCVLEVCLTGADETLARSYPVPIAAVSSAAT